jgi:cytochrome c-type biogenesis protein CcmH
MHRRALLLGLLLAGSAVAQVTHEGFDDPELDARYREFIHTIRCMKCQNQSIAESPVDQAAEVRRLVRDRMAAGESEDEIRAYLISRYGDFISYRPPLKPSTYVLWAAPAILLLGGGFIFARIVRTHMRQPLDEDIDE